MSGSNKEDAVDVLAKVEDMVSPLIGEVSAWGAGVTEQLAGIEFRLAEIANLSRKHYAVAAGWKQLTLEIAGEYERAIGRLPNKAEMRNYWDRFIAAEPPFYIREVQAELLTHPERKKVSEEQPDESENLNACFLKADAQYSTHYLLAHGIPEKDWLAELEWCRAHGYGLLHLYLWVDGDYQGRWKYAWERSDSERVLRMFAQARAHGVEPCVWLMSDDGFSYFDRGNVDAVLARWREAVDYLLIPGKVRYVVPGLEAVEYWDAQQYDRLGRELRQMLPVETKIIHHSHPFDEWMMDAPWIDMLGAQTGFERHRDADALAWVKSLGPKYGKPVIAAEYSMSGESAEAMELGRRFIDDAGAVAGWTGVVRKQGGV